METNNNNLSENGIPRRRALGKGLEELFNSEVLDYSAVEEKILTETPKEEIVNIKLSELRANPYQPRKNFDEQALEELASSIKEHGVFQPIIVKKSIKGYEIIAGERRVKASQMAGLEEIPAIVRDFNDTQMMEIALLENLQREDLNAIEEAEAYSKLLKMLNTTQEELGRRLGKSRSHITNMLGLLRLPEVVKKDVKEGNISVGHAKVLSKLESDEQIISLAKKIKDDSISVRELEGLVENPEYKRKKEIVKVKEPNNYGYVEEILTDTIGNKVKIKNKKIVIPFNSDKDLERILDILKIEVKVD
jgi:ParB family chromosome partitioning protein